jgi:hypothetical protein
MPTIQRAAAQVKEIGMPIELIAIFVTILKRSKEIS